MTFQEESRHSLWPRTGHLPAKLPFSPFLPALHCFLVDVMLRTTSVSWEWRQGHLQSSFICSYCTHRQKNPERLTFWKREIQEQWVPAWSSFLEVFFSQKKLWGFSFLSARALPSHRCPQTLLQRRVSGLHRPARLIPCRANILPKRKKTEDWNNSHPCTRQASYLNWA